MHVKNQMDNRIKNYNLFNTYFKLKKKAIHELFNYIFNF